MLRRRSGVPSRVHIGAFGCIGDTGFVIRYLLGIDLVARGDGHHELPAAQY